MGLACCTGINDPETYLKEVFTTSCLLNLKQIDIDNLLFEHIHGENDIINKTNLEINSLVYSEIVKDILDCKYLKNSNDREKLGNDFRDQDIVRKFLLNLFPLFNYNPTTNCLIFKLIMCPFILNDDLISNEKKCEILYEKIKLINYSDKDENLLEPDMSYNRFCEAFSVYLAIVLSGFTKVLSDVLNEKNNKDEELLREGFIENLNTIFNPDNIRDYYKIIINDLIIRLEHSKDFINLDQAKVNYQDFKFLCEKKPIVDYFKLRENFINFSKNKRNDKFLMN